MSNVVQMVSELEMLGFIKTNGTACRFVSITTKTPVVKIRAGNPFHKVSKGEVIGECNLFKISRKIGLVNAKYNNSVRRKIAEKLGVELSDVEYENGEVWYEHLTDGDGKPLPIVQHKDETKRAKTGYSLQYFPHKSFNNTYVNGAGEVVPDETVKPWLHKESKRPDWKPSVIAPKLRHIVQLKASGVIIEMPDFAEAEALLAD